MEQIKEKLKETTLNEAVSIFGRGFAVKCIVPEKYCDEAFEICDEGDAEYTFDHGNYDNTMPLTETMIQHGKWYLID